MRLTTLALPLLAALPSVLVAQAPSREDIERVAANEFLPAIDRYRELLSLENNAHFPDDIARVLGWLQGAFEERGFSVRELETPSSPLLLAERLAPGADRTVLFYLQADGQPVSPEHWHQESPYEAVIRERVGSEWRDIQWSRLAGAWDPEWRIFARSASDSKGPIAQFLAALSVADSMEWTPDFKYEGDHRRRRGVGLTTSAGRRRTLSQ